MPLRFTIAAMNPRSVLHRSLVANPGTVRDLDSERPYGAPGAGGSMGYADPEAGIGYGSSPERSHPMRAACCHG